MDIIVWAAIIACLIQSGIFSGLTIGLFSLSRLKLEVEAESGNKDALKVLKLRKDSNYLLTTLLWGNVSVNVLVALLTDSVMSGVTAFAFSTICITFFGEIMPQAYFTRKALVVGSTLAPLVIFYQIVFYPVAKPTALFLDWWLGREKLVYLKEESLKMMLKKHVRSSRTEIGLLEGMGALNFLSIDDVNIRDEGSPIDPESIITLPVVKGIPKFPEVENDPADPFLQKVNASGKKWVLLVDPEDRPVMVMDADDFLRDVLYKGKVFNPLKYCHRPIMVTSPDTHLDSVIPRFKVYPTNLEDDVIDADIIVYWGPDEKRIITGSDILGRLLRGIVIRV